MNVAADPVSADLIERIVQRHARLLQAKVLLLPGPEDVDVVDDVVVISEDDAIALRHRHRALVQHQSALDDRDGRSLSGNDGSHHEGDGEGYDEVVAHG